MIHIKKFNDKVNEEFWPFKKSKKDDDIVINLLKKLNSLNKSDIKEDKWDDTFEFTFDGDDFYIGDKIEINNIKLECSDDVVRKFYKFIESKYNEKQNSSNKENYDNLRNK